MYHPAHCPDLPAADPSLAKFKMKKHPDKYHQRGRLPDDMASREELLERVRANMRLSSNA